MADRLQPPSEDSLPGLMNALVAYLFWGFLPLYMKALGHIPPPEVVGHRVLWSVPIALGVLWWSGQVADLRRALGSPRTVAMGLLTALLISVNWGLYVWAIGSGHAVDASLGYYINPLFSVFLGATLLGERLTRLQWVAIALAVVAVGILAVDAGQLPRVALGLTVSWGGYAFFKKWLPIGANQGFALEVLLLMPLALGYLGWLAATGQSHFARGVPGDTALLLGCGVVTAVPLLFYANGSKGLRLSTIAILQYLTPTMILLTAVVVFGEPLTAARKLAFPLIWLALALYTASMLDRARRARQVAAR